MLGRPKKPLSERRRNKVQVSFTDAELREVERAAGKEALGSWLGEAGLKAAAYAKKSHAAERRLKRLVKPGGARQGAL